MPGVSRGICATTVPVSVKTRQFSLAANCECKECNLPLSQSLRDEAVFAGLPWQRIVNRSVSFRDFVIDDVCLVSSHGCVNAQTGFALDSPTRLHVFLLF